MPTNTITAADSTDLLGEGWGDLEQAFESGQEPDSTELDGVYRGRLISVRGIDVLPPLVHRVVDILAGTPLLPWRGKRFGAADVGRRSGSNVWLTMRGPDLISFRVSRAERSLVLDYDVPANPPPLRTILGEVRRLGPGLYLGRMSVRSGQRTTPLLWFTLDNA